jgi:hypothetical protein
MGLHKHLIITPDNAMLSTEAEQRQRVFWVLYALDKNISIRLGRPSMISDDDIGLVSPLPTQTLEIARPDSHLSDRHHIFLKLVMLSQIESRIYSELYSSNAERKSASERLKSIVSLNQQIKSWRSELLPDVRPGDTFTCLPDERAGITMLHLVYHNGILAIHRSPLHSSLWTAKADPIQDALSQDPEIRELMESSQHLCINSARWSLKLVKQLHSLPENHGLVFTKCVLFLLPSRTFAYVDSIYYTFNAITTLFANIIQDPRQETVNADRTLMRTTVGLLRSPRHASEPDALSALTHLYQALDEIMCRIIERSQAHDTDGERALLNDIGAWTDHIDQRVSMTLFSLLDARPCIMETCQPRSTDSK